MLPVVLRIIAALSLANNGIFRKTECAELPPTDLSHREYMEHATYNEFSPSVAEDLQNIAATKNDGTKKLNSETRNSVHNDKNNEEWAKYLQYQILNRMESLMNSQYQPKNARKVNKADQTVTVIKDNESNHRSQRLSDRNSQSHQSSATVAEDSKSNAEHDMNMEATESSAHEEGEKLIQRMDTQVLNENRRRGGPREVTYRGLESNNPWLSMFNLPRLRSRITQHSPAAQPTQENAGVVQRNDSTEIISHGSQNQDDNKVASNKAQSNGTQIETYSIQQHETDGAEDKSVNYNNTANQRTDEDASKLVNSINAEIAKLEEMLITNITHRLNARIATIIQEAMGYKYQKTEVADEANHTISKHQRKIINEDLQRRGNGNRVPNMRKVSLKNKNTGMNKTLQPDHEVQHFKKISSMNNEITKPENKLFITSADRSNQPSSIIQNKTKYKKQNRVKVGKSNYNSQLQSESMQINNHNHPTDENVTNQLPQANENIVPRNKSPLNTNYSPSRTRNSKIRKQKASGRTNYNRQHEIDATARKNVRWSDTIAKRIDSIKNLVSGTDAVGTKASTSEKQLIRNYISRLDRLISTLEPDGDTYKAVNTEKADKSKYNRDGHRFQNKEQGSRKLLHSSAMRTPKVELRSKAVYKKERLRQPQHASDSVAKQYPQSRKGKPLRQKSNQDTSIVNEINSNNNSLSDISPTRSVAYNSTLQDAVNDIAKETADSGDTSSQKTKKVQNSLKPNSSASAITAKSKEGFLSDITNRMKQYISTIIGTNGKYKDQTPNGSNKSNDNRDDHQYQRTSNQKLQKPNSRGSQLGHPGMIRTAEMDLRGKGLHTKKELSKPQEEIDSAAEVNLRNKDLDTKKKVSKSQYEVDSLPNPRFQNSEASVSKHKSRHHGYNSSQRDEYKVESSKIQDSRTAKVNTKAIMNIVEDAINVSSQRSAEVKNDFKANSTGNTQTPRTEELFIRNVADGLKRLILTLVEDGDQPEGRNSVNEDQSSHQKRKIINGNLKSTLKANLRKGNFNTKRKLRLPQYRSESIRNEPELNTSITTNSSTRNKKNSYLMNHQDRSLIHPKNETENSFRQDTIHELPNHTLATKDIKDSNNNINRTKSSSQAKVRKGQQITSRNIMPGKQHFDSEKSRYLNLIRQLMKRKKTNETKYLKYLMQTKITDPNSIGSIATKTNERKKRTTNYHENSKQSIKKVKGTQRRIGNKNRYHRRRGKATGKGRLRMKAKKRFGTAVDKHNHTPRRTKSNSFQQKKLRASSNARKPRMLKRYKSKRSLHQSNVNMLSSEKDKSFNDKFGVIDNLSTKSLHKKLRKRNMRRTRESPQQDENFSNEDDDLAGWKVNYDIQPNKKAQKLKNLNKSSVKKKKGKKMSRKRKLVHPTSKTAMEESGTTKNIKKGNKKLVKYKQGGKKYGLKGGKEGKTKDGKKKKKSKKKLLRKDSTLKVKTRGKGKTNAITKGTKVPGRLALKAVKKNFGKHEKKKDIKQTPNKYNIIVTPEEINARKTVKATNNTIENKENDDTKATEPMVKLQAKNITAEILNNQKTNITTKAGYKQPTSEERKIESSISNESLITSNKDQKLKDEHTNFPYSVFRLPNKDNAAVNSNIENTNKTEQPFQNLYSKTSVEKAQTPVLSSKITVIPNGQNSSNQNFSINTVSQTGTTAPTNKTIQNDASIGNITATNKTTETSTNIGNITEIKKPIGSDSTIDIVAPTNKAIENNTSIDNIAKLNKTIGNETNIGNTTEKELISNGANISSVAHSNETLARQKVTNLTNDNEDIGQRNMIDDAFMQELKLGNTLKESINSNGTINQKANTTVKVESGSEKQLIENITDKPKQLNFTVNKDDVSINNMLDLSKNSANDEFNRRDINGGETTSQAEMAVTDEYIKKLNLGNLTQMLKETMEITDTLSTYFNINYSNGSILANPSHNVQTNATPTIEHQNITERIIGIYKKNHLPNEGNGSNASLVQFNETKIVKSSYKTFVFKKKE